MSPAVTKKDETFAMMKRREGSFFELLDRRRLRQYHFLMTLVEDDGDLLLTFEEMQSVVGSWRRGPMLAGALRVSFHRSLLTNIAYDIA